MLHESLEVRVGRRRWVLRPGDEAILGRDDSCQVVLVDSRISRWHASVAHQDGWHIRDLSSSNGVYTDGSRRSVIAVPEATSIPGVSDQISDRDAVRLGEILGAPGARQSILAAV